MALLKLHSLVNSSVFVHEERTCLDKNATLSLNGCTWSVAPPYHIYEIHDIDLVRCAGCTKTKEECFGNMTLARGKDILFQNTIRISFTTLLQLSDLTLPNT